MRYLACSVSALFLMSACSPKYNVIDITEEEEPVAEVNYDGATLRIIRPQSGSFVPYADVSDFEAELLGADGEPLEFNEVQWSSSADAQWTKTGIAFPDDSLDVGLHNITAQVSLPNGDRLAYSVGGVLVQSVYAGTYVGTFSTNVQYESFPLGCAGSAIMLIGPYGDVLTGDADCLASLGGFDAPLAFQFDVEHDGDGELSGVVAADLFGWFEVDFDAEGAVDLSEETLTLNFGGAPFDSMEVDGSVTADRISLDSGL